MKKTVFLAILALVFIGLVSLVAVVTINKEAFFSSSSNLVEGTLTISADEDTFENVLVDIRMYEYDPFLADVSADLFDQIKLKDFSHTKGEATDYAFNIGSGVYNPERSYYITVSIYQGNDPTPSQQIYWGRCSHDDFCNVLGDGPTTITIVAEPS